MDARTGTPPRDGFAVSEAEIAALKAHPRFAKACRQAAVTAIKQYRGSRLLNGLVNDQGRSAISVLALYLHRARQPEDARSGLLLSRLKAICADQNLASPGRIEAFMLLMRLFGLIRQVPGTADQRVRQLVPTERMITMLHERWDGALAAMTLVIPEAEAIRTALSDEAFERALVQRFGTYFLAGYRLMEDPTAMGLFAERSGGLMVAFSLVTAGGPDDFPPRAPVTVSISAMARQFGVSRVHVRKMLRDAAAAGYIAWLDGRETTIRVRPPLYAAIQTFFAKAFLALRLCANEAFDEVAATRKPRRAQTR